jgi:hypothetical protein
MSSPTLFANNQLVANAAVKEILGGADYVGPTLPKQKNGAFSWQDTGFVQVLPMVGSRDMDTDMRSPIVSIDVWGVGRPGSAKAPFGLVNNLCELVLHGAKHWKPHRVTLPGAYPNARVYTMVASTEPRRVPDLQSYAHMNFHLVINWSEMTW